MLREHLRRFLSDESGPTAAEYAVLLGLIVVGVIVAVTAVGNSTSGLWSSDINRITTAIGS